jgi:hypothetical protein
MSFQRLPYDHNAYQQKIADNVDTFSLEVDGNKYENYNKCNTHSNKYVNIQSMSSRVDMESELYGLSRLNSHSQITKYLPCKRGDKYVSCTSLKTINPRLCERTMVNYDAHLPKDRLYDTSFKLEGHCGK